MPHSWPLVGRREELEFLERATNRPGTAGVVVAGTPGVGKTRLVREALSRAEGEGRTTAWSQATRSSAQIPFGAFAHFLPPRMAGFGRPNLLRTAADAIAELSPEGSFLLGVDDAHLLDDHSAALIHLLAETNRCAIIATVRSGEPVPDPITALWKDELAERLELQPLSREEVEELLDEALYPSVDPSTRHKLWEVTRGNVLFLRELVLGGLETGRLQRVRDVWRWRGAFADVPRLIEVLEERLRTIGVQERALLEIVAAAEPISLDAVEGLREARRLDAADATGLLEVSTGKPPMVGISHPLYAEALRERTPPRRRRANSRRLAEAVSARGPLDGHDLLRVATWRLEAGDRDRDLFVAAARSAISSFDYGLAERLARAALGSEGIQADIALAEALIGGGRFDEAETLLAGLEEGELPNADLARVTITRSSNLFWHLGHGDDAALILENAERAIADPALRCELEAARVACLLFGGHTREAIDLAAEIVDRPTATDRAVLEAASMWSWALNVAGRPKEAKGVGDRFIDLARRRAVDVPFAADWLDSNAVFVFSGRIGDAEAGMLRRHRAAIERRADPIRAGYEFGLGWTYRLQGKIRTAQRWLRNGAELMREHDPFNNLSATLAELAHACALAGDPAAAAEALDEAEATRAASFRMDEGHIGLARAWVAAERGEVSVAQTLARGTADAVASMGQSTYEASSLHDVARLGAPKEAVDRLRALCRSTDTLLIPVFAAHADSLARGDPAGLEECSNRFEDLGADLYAAEAAAEASRVHRREGRRGSALAVAARARALAARCEGAQTPALAHMERDLPLTRREEEIATLAAHGLSNREIAERLVVSVRTVDNHLHSAYAKLGVGGRGELAPILLAASARSK